MRIYTRTGDGGETGLVGGQRVSKTSMRIRAIGDVDELNAALGMARGEGASEGLDAELVAVQGWLFELGAELASAPQGRKGFALLPEAATARLERSIDVQTERLEPLRNFILPAGSRLGSALHFARSVCRRAERSVLELHAESELRPELLAFLNRLSDWLFVAARTANAEAGVEDVPWMPAQPSGS